MHRRTVAAAVAGALALGLSGLASPPAPATPVSGAFLGLLLDLQTRSENDFGGPLTPALKKQKRAVLKSLSLILDRPAAAYIDDMKTFALVAKVLEGAYPAEMTFGSGSSLRLAAHAPVDDIDLVMAFSSDIEGLQYRLYRLAPSGAQAKAAKILLAAQAADAQGDPTYSLAGFAKYRLKAWKLAQKGLKIAFAATALPQPTMDFTADGVAYAADGITSYADVGWTYHSVTKRIEVSCTYTDNATNESRVIHLSGLLVAGSPTVAIDDGQYEVHSLGAGDEIHPATGGTITVGTLDLVHHSFSGSFDMPVSGSTSFGVSGTFTATWHLVVVAD